MKYLFVALFSPLVLSSCVVKRTTYDSHKGTSSEKYVIKRPITEAIKNSKE